MGFLKPWLTIPDLKEYALSRSVCCPMAPVPIFKTDGEVTAQVSQSYSPRFTKHDYSPLGISVGLGSLSITDCEWSDANLLVKLTTWRALSALRVPTWGSSS